MFLSQQYRRNQMRIFFCDFDPKFLLLWRRWTNTRNSSHKPPKLVLLCWSPDCIKILGNFWNKCHSSVLNHRFPWMYVLEFRYAFQNWDDLWEFQVKFLFLENSFSTYHIRESFISQIYFTIRDKRSMSTTDHSVKRGPSHGGDGVLFSRQNW